MRFVDRCSASYRKVRDWMRLAKQPVPERPTFSEAQTRQLRAALLMEELDEFLEACDIVLEYRGETIRLSDLTMSRSYTRVIILADVAHELADLNFVLLGTMITFGLPDDLLMEEVCSANNFKVGHPDYPSMTDDRGKVVKHPNTPKPNFYRVLSLSCLEDV